MMMALSSGGFYEKSRIERIFRRIGAETKINDKVDFAVIYPLIDKSDFSDKIRQEVGCIDEECFVMLCRTELVVDAKRGDKVECRNESYVILSKHMVSIGKIGLYAQCYLKKFVR